MEEWKEDLRPLRVGNGMTDEIGNGKYYLLSDSLGGIITLTGDMEMDLNVHTAFSHSCSLFCIHHKDNGK